MILFFPRLVTWRVCHLSFGYVAGGWDGGGDGGEEETDGRGEEGRLHHHCRHIYMETVYFNME